MKDSISSSLIFNRKIVTEIRYLPNPIVSDHKGGIIESLKHKNLVDPFKWKFGLADVTIADGDNERETRETIFFDPQRLTYINSNFTTNQSYCDKFNKIFKVFREHIGKGNVKITRIGCRIQGTYSCTADSYDKILERFLGIFPNQFFLDSFEPKDLSFQLVYENGMYTIGPVKAEDPFLRSHFKYENRNNAIGFAIDTDNYVSKEASDDYIPAGKVTDVMTASLSVEKYLFDKLKSL